MFFFYLCRAEGAGPELELQSRRQQLKCQPDIPAFSSVRRWGGGSSAACKHRWSWPASPACSSASAFLWKHPGLVVRFIKTGGREGHVGPPARHLQSCTQTHPRWVCGRGLTYLLDHPEDAGEVCQRWRNKDGQSRTSNINNEIICSHEQTILLKPFQCLFTGV